MLTILRNNYSRMAKRLPSVLIMVIITLLSMALAVYMTTQQQMKGHIVLVTQSGAASTKSAHLDVTVLKKAPPDSALVRGQYDAYVFDEGGGKYRIQTLRNAQFKALVQALLANLHTPVPKQSGERGTGENIIGFSMLFLLMGTFANLFTFGEDREQGQLSRIAVTPTSLGSYLAGHFMYALTMFLPPFVLLVLLRAAGFSIGFSLAGYALLFVALDVLGISLALLLNTLFDKADNANMFGSSIVVFTTVLAGGFYANSQKNAVLDNIIRVLPQKELMAFAAHLENGTAWTHPGSLLYVFVFGAVLFVLAFFLLRRKVQNG
ncbi:MAG: ABC transporter permease [Ethanoligenens sp.]